MKKRVLKNMEWWIVVWGIALSVIGLIALFSATSEENYNEFTKQIIWIVVSIVVMIIMMLIDYNMLIKSSPILYAGSIILLIIVLFTKPINGARSWFNIKDGLFSFQPAEISKIFVILFLAYVISVIQRKGRTEINRISKLALILLTILVPIGLIVIQPDYGTGNPG